MNDNGIPALEKRGFI